jgi:ribosomal protein S18 acetylase RimI-like enzyme
MMDGKILSFVDELRLGNPLFVTNAYALGDQPKAMVAEPKINCQCFKGGMFFMRDEYDFQRAFFHVRSLDAISEMSACMRMATAKPIICELILRCSDANGTIVTFRDAGWSSYAELTYMTAHPKAVECGSYKTEKARLDDVDILYELLYSTFDQMISHLPDRKTLCLSIQNGDVDVIRVDDCLGAFAIWQKTGVRTLYLYQLVVAPNFKRKGLAKCLLATAFARMKDPRSTVSLWVDKQNDSAIRLYESLGYTCQTRKLIIFKLSGGKWNG